MSFTEPVGGFLNDVTGQTSSMKAQQKFNAEEAQKQREWEEHMSNTAYQRAVTDMKAAGINPALAYQQGGASTPSAASASAGPGQGSLGQIASIVGAIGTVINSGANVASYMNQKQQNKLANKSNALLNVASAFTKMGLK